MGRKEGFHEVTPGLGAGGGAGWLEEVGGLKGTSGGSLEMFVFSPKSRLQGENEYVHHSSAAEEAEET